MSTILLDEKFKFRGISENKSTICQTAINFTVDLLLLISNVLPLGKLYNGFRYDGVNRPKIFWGEVYNLNNLFKAKLNIQQTFVDVDIPKV